MSLFAGTIVRTTPCLTYVPMTIVSDTKASPVPRLPLWQRPFVPLRVWCSRMEKLCVMPASRSAVAESPSCIPPVGTTRMKAICRLFETRPVGMKHLCASLQSLKPNNGYAAIRRLSARHRHQSCWRKCLTTTTVKRPTSIVGEWSIRRNSWQNLCLANARKTSDKS